MSKKVRFKKSYVRALLRKYRKISDTITNEKLEELIENDSNIKLNHAERSFLTIYLQNNYELKKKYRKKKQGFIKTVVEVYI